MRDFLIRDARARSIYDSRGRPTVEVEVGTVKGSGRGVAPAGASTGSFEAVELRDPDGVDVKVAIKRFETEIRALLLGRDCRDQEAIDQALCELDGTANKSRLGGNTLIATSLSVLNAAASSTGKPLWRYLTESTGLEEPLHMPLPEIQIIGGGAHANRRINLQDIMAIPVGAPDWGTALFWCAQVYHAVGELLNNQSKLRGVADEGGFWPNVSCIEETFELVTQGIEAAGLKPAEEVAISIDVAASQFFHRSYYLSGEEESLNTGQWLERLLAWTRQFPILMVEDPCAEEDIEGFTAFCTAFRKRGLVVGDDLVVTRTHLINKAHAAGAITAALIKPNQVGTVSEAKSALHRCRTLGLAPVLSARSGETEDHTVMDLAVAWQSDMVKVGSITRGERTAKWNQGIRIAEQLENQGQLVPSNRFPWG